jgi:formylglycine-generating enzyme required for sulfatase activity
MKRSLIVGSIFTTLFLFLAAQPVAMAQEGPRFALVIGNGDYKGLPNLKNPVNDAIDMEASLTRLGFVVERLVNADLMQMENAIVKLTRNLASSKDSMGLFFYAGHGVQSGGVNYLIPSRTSIVDEAFLKSKAMSAQDLLDMMQHSGNKLNLVFLDACRDNPFGWARGGQRGLSVVGNQPPGSIIVYATGAGGTAADGNGRNGVFTGELLKHIETPGLSLNDLLDRTAMGVLAATNNAQNPAVYKQYFGTVFMKPGSPAISAVPTPGAGVTGAGTRPGSVDAEASAKGSANIPAGSSTPATGVAGVPAASQGSLEPTDEAGAPGPVLHGEVYVQAGSFQMGSSIGDGDEKPVHTVSLKSFWMMKTEVTVASWRLFSQKSAYASTAEKQGSGLVFTGGAWAPKKDASWKNPYFPQTESHPVVLVSWYDAVEYANWLSRQDNLRPAYSIKGTTVSCDWSAEGWRLPTESEWEYAARGGSKSRGYTYAGSNDVGIVAWYDSTSGSGTKPVGIKKSNELGLYDMNGNVWEWCWDWFDNYSAGSRTDPKGPVSGSSRVNRGGSWHVGDSRTRLTSRSDYAPDSRGSYLGFRLVRSFTDLRP